MRTRPVTTGWGGTAERALIRWATLCWRWIVFRPTISGSRWVCAMQWAGIDWCGWGSAVT